MQKGQKAAISHVQSRHNVPKFSEYFYPIDINIKSRFP